MSKPAKPRRSTPPFTCAIQPSARPSCRRSSSASSGSRAQNTGSRLGRTQRTMGSIHDDDAVRAWRRRLPSSGRGPGRGEESTRRLAPPSAGPPSYNETLTAAAAGELYSKGLITGADSRLLSQPWTQAAHCFTAFVRKRRHRLSCLY